MKQLEDRQTADLFRDSHEKPKPGRPPIHGRAMTAAERKRRQREKHNILCTRCDAGTQDVGMQDLFATTENP